MLTVYDALRRVAQTHMNAERGNNTLSATAVVHEAYLRLAAPRDLPWQHRAHFYVAAAEAIRRILIDHARARGRAKRGGDRPPVNLDTLAELPGRNAEPEIDFIALDEAICRLKEQDPRAAAEVVRLRYFAGLSFADTALALNVSEKTAKNDWAFAKAWLARELGEEPTGEDRISLCPRYNITGTVTLEWMHAKGHRGGTLMVQRLDAIYKNGVFSPLQAVQGLSESSRVRLTIEGAESSGKALAEIAGILPDEDAREIHAMIEQEFEQVDARDW